MENSFFELQKKFNLFAVNAVVRGTVVSADREKLNIKLSGGAMAAIPNQLYQSYEEKGLKLKVGKSIEGMITEITDGIPYLRLTESFILTGKAQRAFVKISGPQGIVVGFEFDENIIGFYQSDKELQSLAERTAIICSNLTKEKDYYKIGKFELDVKKEPEVKAVPPKHVKMRRLEDVYKMPEDWSDDYIKEHFTDSQFRESKDEFRLGRCYLAKLDTLPRLIIFRDNIKGQVTERNGHDPKPGESILVRITKITPFGQIEVEILDVPNREYVLWFYAQRDKEGNVQDEKPSKAKNGFDFGTQDKKIFAIGMNDGSLHQFHQYWLGHLYEVRIKSGAPFFETRAVPFIKVKLIDSDVLYQENDIVYTRIHYISRKDDMVTFTVQVVYADHVDFV